MVSRVKLEDFCCQITEFIDESNIEKQNVHFVINLTFVVSLPGSFGAVLLRQQPGSDCPEADVQS